MSPAPRGPLRIEARIEAARAPVTTAEPLASSALQGSITLTVNSLPQDDVEDIDAVISF